MGEMDMERLPGNEQRMEKLKILVKDEKRVVTILRLESM